MLVYSNWRAHQRIYSFKIVQYQPLTIRWTSIAIIVIFRSIQYQTSVLSWNIAKSKWRIDRSSDDVTQRWKKYPHAIILNAMWSNVMQYLSVCKYIHFCTILMLQCTFGDSGLDRLLASVWKYRVQLNYVPYSSHTYYCFAKYSPTFFQNTFQALDFSLFILSEH